MITIAIVTMIAFTGTELAGIIAATAAGIAVIVGAIVSFIVALRQHAKADIRVAETKVAVDDGITDIRRDIGVLAAGMATIDERFVVMEGRVQGTIENFAKLNSNQEALMELLVGVEAKLPKRSVTKSVITQPSGASVTNVTVREQ